MRKKLIIGTAVIVAGVGAIRRFGPSLHRQAMNRCEEMFHHVSGALATTQAAGDPRDVVTDIPCDPAGCAPHAADRDRALTNAN